MPEIPFPRGVKDLMPNEALFRNELLKRVEDVFQRFGFAAIDTPTFEPLAVLNAKNAIGEDTKLIYELKEESLGLRYDFTVSLARYMAMHQELPMPFKRYQIGKVWRREEPQKLRYREITQADIDIVGGVKALADAEVIAADAYALESIGIEYIIGINDRTLMEKVFEKLGMSGKLFVGAARALDKMEKIGKDKVSDALRGLGIGDETVDGMIELAELSGSNEKKLAYVEKLLGDENAAKDLKDTLVALEQYGMQGEAAVDFSLMRGLDYYTGIVFEFKAKMNPKGPSVGGGGRYDNLIGIYAGRPMPAVGAGLGIDRILDMLDYSSSTECSYARVFVAYVKANNYNYALKVANTLRAGGVATEINISSRNLANQLAHANSLKMRYVIIIGDVEEKSKKLKLRNLASGEEQILSLEEAIELIKGV